MENGEDLYSRVEQKPLLLSIIGITLFVEMILRFFPSSLESMGCQKQFAGNYRPVKKKMPGNDCTDPTEKTVLRAIAKEMLKLEKNQQQRLRWRGFC
ncbi:MAG: hypothetical protein IJ468_01740 [Lachnospiraceae bacterium]|nr:hypothetical protein [Lachnospiraceae bacterium]